MDDRLGEIKIKDWAEVTKEDISYLISEITKLRNENFILHNPVMAPDPRCPDGSCGG